MANFDPECRCGNPLIKCDNWGCRCTICGGYERIAETAPSPARSPDPTAEAVSALRDLWSHGACEMLVTNRQGQHCRSPTGCHCLEIGMLKRDNTALLADIAALRTRAEEPEARADAATADRDRLVEENARLRAALKFYAQDDVWRLHGECNPEHAWFTGPDTALRALTATGGTNDAG